MDDSAAFLTRVFILELSVYGKPQAPNNLPIKFMQTKLQAKFVNQHKMRN